MLVVGGKLLQTFTRSEKVFPRVRAAVVYRQLEGLPRVTVRSPSAAISWK